MRLLLDTQVFLWMQAAPERLSARGHELLGDRANELFLSAASAWEIAIKFAAGKLALPSAPTSYVTSRMADSFITPLPITFAHAGTYPLRCLVHPAMTATLKVSP